MQMMSTHSQEFLSPEASNEMTLVYSQVDDFSGEHQESWCGANCQDEYSRNQEKTLNTKPLYEGKALKRAVSLSKNLKDLKDILKNMQLEDFHKKLTEQIKDNTRLRIEVEMLQDKLRLSLEEIDYLKMLIKSKDGTIPIAISKELFFLLVGNTDQKAAVDMEIDFDHVENNLPVVNSRENINSVCSSEMVKCSHEESFNISSAAEKGDILACSQDSELLDTTNEIRDEKTSISKLVKDEHINQKNKSQWIKGRNCDIEKSNITSRKSGKKKFGGQKRKTDSVKLKNIAVNDYLVNSLNKDNVHENKKGTMKNISDNSFTSKKHRNEIGVKLPSKSNTVTHPTKLKNEQSGNRINKQQVKSSDKLNLLSNSILGNSKGKVDLPNRGVLPPPKYLFVKPDNTNSVYLGVNAYNSSDLNQVLLNEYNRLSGFTSAQAVKLETLKNQKEEMQQVIEALTTSNSSVNQKLCAQLQKKNSKLLDTVTNLQVALGSMYDIQNLMRRENQRLNRLVRMAYEMDNTDSISCPDLDVGMPMPVDISRRKMDENITNNKAENKELLSLETQLTKSSVTINNNEHQEIIAENHSLKSTTKVPCMLPKSKLGTNEKREVETYTSNCIDRYAVQPTSNNNPSCSQMYSKFSSTNFHPKCKSEMSTSTNYYIPSCLEIPGCNFMKKIDINCNKGYSMEQIRFDNYVSGAADQHHTDIQSTGNYRLNSKSHEVPAAKNNGIQHLGGICIPQMRNNYPLESQLWSHYDGREHQNDMPMYSINKELMNDIILKQQPKFEEHLNQYSCV